jgi:hypothetical protein
MKATLATRRARIDRVQAKRPRELVIDIEAAEQSGARDELLDLLIELLDSRRHSRGV